MEKKNKILIALIAVLSVLIIIVGLLCIDARHPEIVLKGRASETLEYGESYIEPGYEAMSIGKLFGVGKKPPEVTVDGSVDVTKLGTYDLTYTARCMGRSISEKRTVTHVDTKPPEITLAHTEGYIPSWMDGYIEEGFTANDNYDGDLSARVERTELSDRVVYTVEDSSGNKTEQERPIAYGIGAPRITLNGAADMKMYATTYFSDPGWSAYDENGNDMSAYVQVSGEVCPYAVGDYQLVYSVTNAKGDSVSEKRNVTVLPVETPNTVKPGTKTIYLTFDDGPGPYTDELLDILGRYGVKATFFVTACDRDYSDMIGRAYREGHSIGVHTYSHDYSSIYASEQAYFNDFQATQELIYAQTGEYTQLFRFPGGSSNTVSSFNPGIMSRLASYMTNMGYKYFDWNVTSGDAGETTDTKKIIQNIKDGCSGLTTSVVLQHDIKNYSVAAVEDIIIWGLENGYQFLPLDITSYGAHHGISN